MEWLLQNFASIFTYTTSFLIAWGMFASHTLFEAIALSYKHRGVIRKCDAMYFVGLTCCTIFLISFLFIFHIFATEYMFALFVFEIWYLVFAIHVTHDQIIPLIVTPQHHTPHNPRNTSDIHHNHTMHF